MNFRKKKRIKLYGEKIDRGLVLIILTGALLLVSPLYMANDFQKNSVLAANDLTGPHAKPQPFSLGESLPGNLTGNVGKLDLHNWLAKLPKAPVIKGHNRHETASDKLPEAPRIEGQKAPKIPTKSAGLVDVRSYGFTEAAIKKAIDATKLRKSTLYFSSGTWRITDKLTIPPRLAIRIDNGAMLSVAKGATLILNGPLVDCLWQIFEDENTDLTKGVKLARHSVTYVRPEWWGLKSRGSGATNWQAVTKALNCCIKAKGAITVLFSPGVYSFNDTIKLPSHCHLKGQNNFSSSGHEGAWLQLASGTNKYFFEGNHIDGPVFENLFICGGYNDADCIYISGGHYGEIKNCYFETSGLGKTRYAIRMNPQNQMVVENCRILAPNGIYAGNIDGWIRSCEIRGPGYAFSNVGIRAAEGPLIHDCIIFGFARGIDSNPSLIYGNRIDQCTICINSTKDNILSGIPYTIPKSPPYTVTVSPHDWAFKDYGVMRRRVYFTNDNIHLTRVAANPGPGQYMVKDTPYGGIYTFNQAEAGKKLWFNYRHANKSGGTGCNAQIICNRLSTSIIGINAGIGSPTLVGNIFTEFKCGGNAIAVLANGPGGLATDNKFQNNDQNIHSDGNGAPLACYDNLGIDLATDIGRISNTISGDLPEVYAGNLWSTANTSPTNITAIKAAAEGHKITLIVDKNSTLRKYWNPSDIYLTSNNNATFRAASGSKLNFSGQKDFNYFQGPKNGEIIYFGDKTRFNSLLFNVKDNVAAKTLRFNWEYCTPWGWIPTLDRTSTWKPHTSYPAGSVVKPTSGSLTLVYISQNRGTSGGHEPNWKRIFHGEYHPNAYITDNNLTWRPFYPLKMTNPDALKTGGTGKVEIWFTPPASTCWMPTNPRNFIRNFSGGPRFWLRCRLSDVTGGTNGGSNNTHAIKKCNIRLTTDSFNPPLKGILNLIYHNHSWLETGRGLL